MHVVKPLWLSHGGELRDHEVYSCHVSPDGTRLVTAAGDAHIRIWSTEAIAQSSNPDYTKPKQLAAISTHSGTIHTVRFSGSNKYLASGADDKIVCVYILDPNPPAHSHTFGSNEPPPVENWRVLRRLVGHDNDVQDLGWSYDSSILVSVGLDSKIVVWSGHTFEKLKTLSQHQSHVKGITFDPANKYFATASDDRSIKVFRFTSPPPNATANDQVNNFVLECNITGPFTNSPLTTYFRRCSWSPDGNHIAAANAVNGPVSSVAIINRGSWDSDINLIGHEGPVEVCAFSPRMFYREPPSDKYMDANGTSLLPSVTAIACAGQDKTLSVWNTSYARPFVVTQELATKPISDLSWGPDGETLYLSCLDGGIMAVYFQPGELGYAAPLQENEKTLTKFGTGRKAGVIEGIYAGHLEELSKADEQRAAQGRMGELMGDGALVPAPMSNANGSAPKANGAASSSVVNGNQASNGNSTNGTTAAQPQADPKVQQLKQRVEIVNGKKRLKPLLISTSGTESTLPQAQLLAATSQSRLPNDAPNSILDVSKPYDGLPKGGLGSLVFNTKRKFAEVEGDEERRIEKRLATNALNGSPAVLLNTAEGLLPANHVARESQPGVPEPLQPVIVNPALTVSRIRLGVPTLRSVIIRTIGNEPSKQADSGADGDSTVSLEAKNGTGPSRTGRAQDRDPTRLTCTRRSQTLWQDYVPKPVLLLTGNANFWAAAGEDGSVYVWTPAGRRLLSPMILDAQPVILDCRGWWLMCISAVGQVHIWNIKTQSAPHPPVSVAAILDVASQYQGPHLTGGPSIVFARLNSRGRVIVAMSNGHGYSYSPEMYAWQRFTEPWWAVGSQYWNTTDSSVGKVTAANQSNAVVGNDEVAPENVSAGIIPLLERNTTQNIMLKGRAYYLQRLVKALLVAEGFEGFEANVSVAHLENRVAAALALGAKEEFRVYLLMYAKRLGAEGLKLKTEELLRTLLGKLLTDEDESTTASEDDGKGWFAPGGDILGWNRADLLKDVLLILGKHRDMHRLTVPYAKLIGIIGQENGDDAMES